MPIDIKDIQNEQEEWARRNFPDRKSYQPLLGAMEELGELAHSHLKEEQGIRTSEDHPENAKDAIGDIIIYLMDYCNQRGFDLAAIIYDTWAGMKRRDWQQNKDIPKDTKFVETHHADN